MALPPAGQILTFLFVGEKSGTGNQKSFISHATHTQFETWACFFMEENDTIDVRIVQSADPEAIVELYKAGGWWEESDSFDDILPLIKGSFAFTTATDVGTGTIVGTGRVLSDGVSDAYIQDVIVLPGYRKRGIAGRIIKTLLAACLKNNVSWIGLVAQPGTEGFYKELGFNRMKGHTPMRYFGEGG